MSEYSFDSATLRKFGARSYPADAAGRFAYWADFTDAVGPAMLPFLVRGERWDDIPFAELGLRNFRPSELAPQPKEMWVLFCYRQSGGRHPAAADSPLRQDGFPLVLEWRADTGDSPLLSPAFRDLAQKVRAQLGAPDWGLHPAFGRYGDKVSFADPGLFSDVEHASSIASAWGALAAGLSCAVRNRWPRVWPFPTIQWNRATGRTAGVAGLPEKLAVAADFGAEVVAVDRSQAGEARAAVRSLRREHRTGHGNGLAIYGVSAGTPVAAAGQIARSSQWKTRRRRRLLAALHLLPVVAAAACAAIWYLRWEVRKVAYGEVVQSLSIHATAFHSAVRAQHDLLDAVGQSVDAGSGRVFTSEVPVFTRAMDNALETMGTARPGEDAFRVIRKSEFDERTLMAFFDGTDEEVERAERGLPALFEPLLGARYPGSAELVLSLLKQQRLILECNATFYALGVMEILAPAKFQSFAKDFRYLPRFSKPWLSDPKAIEREMEDTISEFERIATMAETAVTRTRTAVSFGRRIASMTEALSGAKSSVFPGNRSAETTVSCEQRTTASAESAREMEKSEASPGRRTSTRTESAAEKRKPGYEYSRENGELLEAMRTIGIPEEHMKSILDPQARLSALKAELEDVTRKLEEKKLALYLKNRAVETDDDDLLWGKMMAFKSWKMPDAAVEALDILGRRGSDVYRPGAVRAAEAIVRAGDALCFTNGIMVLSFAPPATSHALFEPGDVVVGYDGHTVGWFPDYKSIPGSTYRFWRLGEDGTFGLHEGVLPPGQPLTAFENVNPEPARQ